jgi:hypothetical protein
MSFIDRRHEPPYELTQGAIAEMERVTEEPSKATDLREAVSVSAREVTGGKPFTHAEIGALREFPDYPARVVLRKGDEVLPEMALVYLRADLALPPEAFPEMALVVPWAEKPTWILWHAVDGGFCVSFEEEPHETFATIEEALGAIEQIIVDTL